MKKAIRTIAVLMCLVMVISSCPLTGFAAGQTDGDTAEPAAIQTEPKLSIYNDDKKEEDDGKEQEGKTEPVKKPTKESGKKLPATKVSGFKRRINEYYNNTAYVKVKITPCNPRRQVRLQLYSKKRKKYIDIKTYTTLRRKTATLKIIFPKKYRKKVNNKWRIVVDKTDKAAKYVSRPLYLTNINAKNCYVDGKAACIYCEDTKQILFDKNMYDRRQVASCTKVMTAVITIEKGYFNETSRVRYDAENVENPNLYIKTGDVVRNSDMVYAMMMKSSNDAAMQLGLAIGGSRVGFARYMNHRAKKLHMFDTHYHNPYGGPRPSHYTSARDLSILIAYASHYPEFMKTVRTKHHTFKTLRYGYTYYLKNKDKIWGYNKHHRGGKTGFSEQAGSCYTGIYRYKGKTYGVTVLGGSTKNKRWNDIKHLYKYIDKYAESSF